MAAPVRSISNAFKSSQSHDHRRGNCFAVISSMRCTAIILLVGLLTLGGFGRVHAEHNSIEGVYQCLGTTAGGEKYRGIVQIAKNEDAYLVRWIVPPDVYIGVGVVQGNTFSVSFASDTLGLAVYTIESDSRMVGRWTTLNAGGQMFLESLTKVDSATTPAPDPDPPVAAPHAAPKKLSQPKNTLPA